MVTEETEDAVLKDGEDSEDREDLEDGEDSEGLEGKDDLEGGEKPPKGLTPEAQHAFEKRVAKERARTKAAEAAAETARKDLDEIRGKWGGNLEKVAEELGLLAEFVTPEEGKAIARARELRANLTWCKNHRQGYQGTGKNDEDMSPDEVASLRDKIEEALEQVGDTARSAQARVKGELKELLDLGRAAKKAGWKPGDLKERERKPIKPPRLPGGGEAGGAAGGPQRRPSAAGMDEEEFLRDGGDEAALRKQIKRSVGR